MNREYIEYNGRIAFHPGYYIREIVDDSGLSHADFAKRLDTTPKNLSILIRGEQSLSPDMAMKLARMLDTSIDYWMNLQASYDSIVAGIESDKELEKEKRILSILDYRYFRDNFDLPDHPRRWKEQVVELRRFLDVASLTVQQNDIYTPGLFSQYGSCPVILRKGGADDRYGGLAVCGNRRVSFAS